MYENLFSVLRKNFPSDDTTFIRTASGRVISYGDMLKRTAQFANALVELGVKPGDRVATQVGKSCEALMLYLGAVRAGAAYLPLNTAYTRAELGYFFSDAEPSLLVCRPSMENALKGECGVAKLETLGDGGEGGSLLALVDAASQEFPGRPGARKAQC